MKSFVEDRIDAEELWIAPVSGNVFPFQISVILDIISFYIPPPEVVMMGASGGNISVNLCMSNDFDTNSIYRVCGKLHSGLFIDKRPIFQIPISNIITRGSAYYHSPYFNNFMENNIPKDFFRRNTVITSVVSSISGSSELYSNKDLSDEEIRKLMLASANIPLLLPPVRIGGKHLEDSLTSIPSPLSLLKVKFRRLLYFHQRNLDALQVHKNVVSKILGGIANIDINLLCRFDFDEIYDIKPCEFQKHLSISCAYVVFVFYPIVEPTLELLTFTGEDLVKEIDYYKNKYLIRVMIKH